MNKALVVIFLVLIGFGALFVWQNKSDKRLLGPSAIEIQKKERPLDKYTIDVLSKTKFEGSEITLGKVIDERADSTSYIFHFYVDGKKVSGLVNVPKLSGEYPVIVMFRGYVDREIYQTGTGTQRAGEVFAQNGFVTLAPDFLGYGESDNPSESPIEERFQTYVTVLTLLESVQNLNSAFSSYNQGLAVSCHSEFISESGEILKQVQDDSDCVGLEKIVATADVNNVGIWGHSNGGQIALTVLEITGRSIPTVLWAPVSKPFPYSILYYTDDFDDRGKMLRRVIAEFEKDYDVELYNLTNYFDRINAPLAVHQGRADDSVPLKWSDQLAEQLEKLDKDVDYFTYFGADHNLLTGGWNLAVSRSIKFWRDKL